MSQFRAALLPFALFLCAPLPALAGGSGGSGGPAGTRNNWPCPGCVTRVPTGVKPTVPASLLVVLHGDEGTSSYAFQAWRPYTDSAGYILVALQCPVALGCQGSFWQWAGDPAWIHQQVDALEADYNIELNREYISGWSGGAMYLASVSPALAPRFAGLNLNSGGMPPQPATCPSSKMPVYMMIGDQDGLVPYAEATRDFFTGCGHEIVWDLLPGLDHMGGIYALYTQNKAAVILQWFSAHPKSAGLTNVCAATEGPWP